MTKARIGRGEDLGARGEEREGRGVSEEERGERKPQLPLRWVAAGFSDLGPAATFLSA